MDARIRSRSLLISLLLHAAILLALIFAVMTSPIPPFPESGGGGGLTFVDIGTVDEAMGDVQPTSVTTTPTPGDIAQSDELEDNDMASQDIEDAPVVKEPPRKNPKPQKAPPVVKSEKPVIKVEPPRTVDPRSIYQGKSNSSASQGTSASGTGDQGNAQGDPGSRYTGKNGTGGGVGAGSGTGTGDGEGPGFGTGKGGGVSFSLAGRKWNRPPPLPKDNTQETGKVVVDITVDKAGNVMTATPGGRGSTTTSAYLFRLAKEAALKAKFDDNPDAGDIQRGTITFVFVVQ